MNLIKCDKGHYYDKDKSMNCPHCPSNSNEKTDNFDENNANVIEERKEEWFPAFIQLHIKHRP